MRRPLRVSALALLLCTLWTNGAGAQLPPPPPPPPPAPAGPPAPAAPAEGSGLILGRVLDAGTGRPVAGALVAATPGGRRVLSDGDGYYVFERIPKGACSLTVTKPGYADGAYGRLRPGGAHVQLELAEGERLADADISLWKFAVITGTVADEAGEPVVGASVRAYRRALAGGRRRLQPQNSATTDDRGTYRIFNLLPVMLGSDLVSCAFDLCRRHGRETSVVLRKRTLVQETRSDPSGW